MRLHGRCKCSSRGDPPGVIGRFLRGEQSDQAEHSLSKPVLWHAKPLIVLHNTPSHHTRGSTGTARSANLALAAELGYLAIDSLDRQHFGVQLAVAIVLILLAFRLRADRADELQSSPNCGRSDVRRNRRCI